MAIIKKYPSNVESVVRHFPGIYTVSFKSLDKPYKYLPGQFLHLALDEYDPSAQWPESRCFSMQTCDRESSIKITYSVKGIFTKRMSEELSEGKKVWLKMPYGELFTTKHPKENAVFIAGGTGVTPFLSLFTSDMFKEYLKPVLYLGVRNKNYHIYGKEIEAASAMNPSFRVFILDQEIDGMLDIGNIYNENREGLTFFISGPPVMIKNFKRFLLDKSIPECAVRTDEWE
jgi:predicted ferric reductase